MPIWRNVYVTPLYSVARADTLSPAAARFRQTLVQFTAT
jgi:hypothetical protein